MKLICVFCGLSMGVLDVYLEVVKMIGYVIVEVGCMLVYGGVKVGFMGIVVDVVLVVGGKVIGVLFCVFQEKEIGYEGLIELYMVELMYECKVFMVDLLDVFIVFFGGVGIFEEIFEVWIWGQFGYYFKLCGFFSVNGYYDQLIVFLDYQMSEGFMKDVMCGMVQIFDMLQGLFDMFRVYELLSILKWIIWDEI